MSAVAPGELPILGQDCPVRRVLRLVGDKWSPVVLHCLSAGVHRFGDLQRGIPDISKKMLVQVLRQLEAEALVKRTSFQGVPPRTDYELTELGRRLHEPMALLCHWATDNVAVLDAIDSKTGQEAFCPGARPEP